MREYACLNYNTVYKSTGTEYCRLKGRFCFAKLFHSVTNDSDNTYHILVYRDRTGERRKQECVHDLRMIRKVVGALHALHPIHYSVYAKGSGYVVRMHVKKAPVLFHLFALAWVRFLYEWPYNMCFRDTLWLKEDPMFKGVSVFNLSMLVFACNTEHFNGQHHIFPVKTFTRFTIGKLSALLREHSRKDGRKTLFGMFKGLDDPEWSHDIRGITTDDGDHLSGYDRDYWSRENFERYRKPIYIEAYRETVR